MNHWEHARGHSPYTCFGENQSTTRRTEMRTDHAREDFYVLCTVSSGKINRRHSGVKRAPACGTMEYCAAPNPPRNTALCKIGSPPTSLRLMKGGGGGKHDNKFAEFLHGGWELLFFFHRYSSCQTHQLPNGLLLIYFVQQQHPSRALIKLQHQRAAVL